MESRVLVGSIALLVAVTGCDDEAGAPGKCRALAREVCEALVDCGLAEESDMGECRADVEADAECDDATHVRGSYAKCLDDINERRQCLEWPDLPESCEGVVSSD